MIQIVFEKENNRAAAYDGEKQVGVCEIVPEESRWTITHTITDAAYGGQGIALRLVRCVAENAQTEKAELIPVCAYAKKVLGK